jgi:glycosyltransferase involved in cell wall biosynthesis
MERLSATFDLGLVGETSHTRNRAICLTNKVFSYVLAGLPPLMSATPALVAFAQKHELQRLLFPIDDADALARRLDEMLLAPQLLERMRAKCFALGQDRYNWERESRVLLNLVGRAIADRVGRERGHS